MKTLTIPFVSLAAHFRAAAVQHGEAAKIVEKDRFNAMKQGRRDVAASYIPIVTEHERMKAEAEQLAEAFDGDGNLIPGVSAQGDALGVTYHIPQEPK